MFFFIFCLGCRLNLLYDFFPNDDFKVKKNYYGSTVLSPVSLYGENCIGGVVDTGDVDT